MARFLLAAWPLLGHINPTIAVAHALRERGHQVAFYTGSSARPIVEGEGFVCFPFNRVDEELALNAENPLAYAGSFLEQVRAARQMKDGLRRWLVETIPGQIEDLEEVLAEWHCDLLISETAMWGPILVLHETHRLPVAVFSTFAACMLPGPDTPAFGRGHPRPRNGLMRLRSTMERKVVWWLSTDFRVKVNAVRQRYRLPPLQITVTEFAGQMPLYLMPSTPEFDYERRDLPPSVHYLGPCAWDKPRDEPPLGWLTQLPKGRPVVHVTEATNHARDPFLLRIAARALKDLPVQVVITTGKHRDPTALNLGPLAPNIQVERYVPHSDLLPKTSVIVTLGGAGTVFAALKAGVPLVIVPTEWDKPENAQRVAEAGAGLRIEPRKCTPERLRAAVERVLSEPSFRQNAQRLAAACARYGGPAQATELLESLAARGRPVYGLSRVRGAAEEIEMERVV